MADPLLFFQAFVVAFRGYRKRFLQMMANFGRRFGIHLMMIAIVLALFFIGQASLADGTDT
ncbi:MAG: hypothetical protein ACE5FD_04220, partial [Anaerolineae bacterium]